MDYGAGHHQSARELPEEGPAFAFTPANVAKLEEICARYPAEWRKSAIIAALFLAQGQQGYITRAAMRAVAAAIPLHDGGSRRHRVLLHDVLHAPVGKHIVQVCRTLSCALMGAERVTEELSKVLGISAGRNRREQGIHARRGRVPRRCDRAPVVGVNDDWHECQAGRREALSRAAREGQPLTAVTCT
jgi:NADH:ubiquinone oxidoreductase subunit E